MTRLLVVLTLFGAGCYHQHYDRRYGHGYGRPAPIQRHYDDTHHWDGYDTHHGDDYHHPVDPMYHHDGDHHW